MAAKFSLEKRELAELSQSYLLEIFIQSQENTEDETTAVFVLGIPGCSSFKVCVISALLLLVLSLAPARAACKELVELPKCHVCKAVQSVSGFGARSFV